MAIVERPLPIGLSPDPVVALGPEGPFPDEPLGGVIERRWLHYAFVSRDRSLGMVANVSWLGPSPEDPLRRPRCMSIVLVHRAEEGWDASQFSAVTSVPQWSAFRGPEPIGRAGRFEVAAVRPHVGVELDLYRTGRPCTSQTATFAPGHHFRWQSEPGIVARGDWVFRDRMYRNVEAVGYHERVRGRWGWPELGGWVFGFANDPNGTGVEAPETSIVVTLTQPAASPRSAHSSVMIWNRGRLVRHFPRRCVSVAVLGLLDRSRVRQTPALANTLGFPPMAPIPRELVITAKMGPDDVVFHFACDHAARVVVPGETGLHPFSVHEVIGPCRVAGSVSGRRFAFETRGIVEFAGGARAD
ncbi:MAG: hypothetical protein BMS9Abin29_1308 [Gemmatimonadota bacterium]|nr:MAG: hypothetical protein BMS9Abin29_1308 [Gemmatimonadota bacterium]